MTHCSILYSWIHKVVVSIVLGLSIVANDWRDPVRHGTQSLTESSVNLTRYEKFVCGFAGGLIQIHTKTLSMQLPIVIAAAIALALCPVTANAAAARLEFVARHYFPAGYQKGTTEGIPDQYVVVVSSVKHSNSQFVLDSALGLEHWNVPITMRTKNCFTVEVRLGL